MHKECCIKLYLSFKKIGFHPTTSIKTIGKLVLFCYHETHLFYY